MWGDKKGRSLECGGGEQGLLRRRGPMHASEHPDANEPSNLCLDLAEEDTVSLWVMQRVKSGPHS